MNKGGFLMFVTISEFFKQILKMNSDGEFEFKLGDCYILICSRDIVTDVIKQRGDANDCQSRYSNVEFVSTLLPDVEMMENATAAGRDLFFEQYVTKLYTPSRMRDIISICDVVAKRDTPVFFLGTELDKRVGYPDILKEFIQTEFGLHGYSMDDLKGLDIPKTVHQIGDKEEIIKAIDKHVDAVLRETDKEYFLNSLVDDVEKVYREVLESKTIEELKEMAAMQSIFISKRDDRERVIDKLIRSIMSSQDV